jgi:hypothetical protein
MLKRCSECHARYEECFTTMNQHLHERMYQTGDKLANDVISKISMHGIPQVNKILRGLILTTEVKDLLDEKTERIKLQHLSSAKSAAPEIGKSLLQYLDGSGQLPTWVDPDLFVKSEEVFEEYGMVAFSILGCAALPEAYVTSYGARVLGITQQLETHVRRRLYETSLLVLSVMSTAGLAQKGQGRVKENGIGIRVAQKVRLMHAAIRHLILHSNTDSGANDIPRRELGDALLQLNWPKKDFGIPINQIAMSVAVLSFSYITLRSLRQLGVRLAPSQERAYLHRWNVVGHIMGVLPELLLEQPETMEAAEELYDALWRPAAVSSREGRMLEKALLDYMEGFIPDHLGSLRRIPRILTRELIGAKTTRLLGVRLGFADNVGFQALKTLMGMYRYGRQMADVTGLNLDWADNAAAQMLTGSFRLRHLTTESMDELTPIRIAAEWLFRLMAHELAHMQRGGDRTPFTIPDELATKWRLQR